MKYRKLGASDLSVSEISLGSWLTFGVGVATDNALACVNRAFELGINFIDTANVYGRGKAETFLGEALAGRKRSSYVLATKVFFPMSDTDKGLSRAQILKQIDASLARLKTDYVDLYQCHRYDPETPLEETMGALSEVVRAGKARYIGFSEWSPEQIENAFAIPGVERFVSSQPQYSLLWRRPEEKVIPICKKHHVSQIVWSPLAQGVLTGKYKPGAAPPKDFARHQRQHGRDDHGLDAAQHSRSGGEAEAARQGSRCLARTVFAGVGVARTECRLGDRGREPSRTAGRQRGRIRASSSIPPCSQRPKPSWPASRASVKASGRRLQCGSSSRGVLLCCAQIVARNARLGLGQCRLQARLGRRTRRIDKRAAALVLARINLLGIEAGAVGTHDAIDRVMQMHVNRRDVGSRSRQTRMLTRGADFRLQIGGHSGRRNERDGRGNHEEFREIVRHGHFSPP